MHEWSVVTRYNSIKDNRLLEPRGGEEEEEHFCWAVIGFAIEATEAIELNKEAIVAFSPELYKICPVRHDCFW